MSRFVMIADSDTGKIVIWDGKKQMFSCPFGEQTEGGWGIGTVQEIMVMAEQPKPHKILYALHDFLFDVSKSEQVEPEPVPV
jgi:hypothetical protein